MKKPQLTCTPTQNIPNQTGSHDNTESNPSQNALQLVDIKYITTLTGMTDKWFYALMSRHEFPKPIKFGRSSRWFKADVESWLIQKRPVD